LHHRVAHTIIDKTARKYRTIQTTAQRHRKEIRTT